MIKMQDVCFDYEGLQVLSGINLTINKGDFVALVGPNGAGKSTFSKLINGLNKPASGSVVTKGMDTRKTRTSQLAKYVGFLFQNPDRQLCCNTIREEILFGLTLCLTDKQDIQRRLDETMSNFDFDPDKNPLTASRGERQRIALASLLALTPELLILDEPTTGLDYTECMRILALIKKLNREQGTTVLMVSHDMEVVRDFADRVLVLSNGNITADGTAHQVLRDENVLRDAALLPPQIMALSQQLGADFDDVDTCEDMVHYIMERKATK